ncbi:MAG: choice-of-anchor Q domain-containing protein [Gammaproteobacteria bacterium]
MPDPKRTPPQALTVFQEELARTAALPGLAAPGPAIWPRFAEYYQGLARLPRRLRRALQRRWRRSLGGIALLCALGQAPALAATIIADGLPCTLVDAITAANTDAPVGGCPAGSGADTIAVPPGSPTLTAVNNSTYGPSGLPVVTSEITINAFVTITRDSSAPQFRILAVGATGNLTLENTTVTGGVAGFFGEGGGIRNEGTLTLNNSTISGNSAGFGGGGIDNHGTLTLTDSTVSGNSADYGGGIDSSFGTLSLTNSTIEGNSAQSRGGGISSPLGFDSQGTHYASVVTLTNTTVSNNTAGTDGGGVSNGDLLTLVNSTISGNKAGTSGGGVLNRSGTELTLSNSTISGNTATDRGGAMDNSGTVTLTNSTVTGNASGRVAGGLFNTGSLTLVQSLLSGNTAPVNGPEAYSVAGQSGQGTVIADGFNVIGHDGSARIAGFALGATDRVPAVPLVSVLDPTLAYNGGPTPTHALVFGSPAIDAVLGAPAPRAPISAGHPAPRTATGIPWPTATAAPSSEDGSPSRPSWPARGSTAGARPAGSPSDAT